MSNPTPSFTTALLIETLPENYEVLVKVLSLVKENLRRLKYFCSIEEHSYVCGSSDTLIKILPQPYGVEARMPEARYFVVKVSINSLIPEKLVLVNDLIASLLKEAGLKYRRIE
ncbi:MAG: hypothetical protein QN229_03675 [Desulfurococcaceae archaeon TW002]